MSPVRPTIDAALSMIVADEVRDVDLVDMRKAITASLKRAAHRRQAIFNSAVAARRDRKDAERDHVLYLRQVKGLKLESIIERTGFSYSRIARIVRYIPKGNPT